MQSKRQRIKLSNEQKEAVEYMGTALVAAGAGSGKTLTLTSKITHLIDLGYPPEKILAITFTNKAADEMKSRLFLQTGLPQDKFPWVRTYHSACFKILKQHCQTLGYKTPLQIYSEYQQQKVLKEILLKLNIDKKYLYGISTHISNAKNTGEPGSYFNVNPRISYIRLLDVYQLYEKELFEKNAVDFDNILLQTRNLLRNHNEIRQYYQSYFLYILVDEYQDTNDLQEELTRLLLGNGNLFCVGDDWQAIYGFRGSNLNHFIKFSKNYKNSKIFRLEQNYRSTSEIVQLANDLIRNNPGQIKKDCFSQKKGGTIEIQGFFSDDEEADWVIDKIEALHLLNIPYEKIAILYRTKFCSLPFEHTLRASGIPYRMLGAKGFFDRKEIMDLSGYLTAAVFPKDDAAFERILNTPKRGVGPSTIKKFYTMHDEKMSLQEAVRLALQKENLPPKLYGQLKDLIKLLDDIRIVSPEIALKQIILQMDYLKHLREYSKSDADFIAREENIEQLIYSASHHSNLVDFIEEASLIKEDKKDSDENDRGVNLSTIHASKGLEYQVVFIAGCEENLLPHWKSKETASDIDEERRLMYVAMTRAEFYLCMTSSSYRKGQYNPKSRFIEEILDTEKRPVN